ncbi:glyoxysomal fatty acid beta-oxidation multifunctional protein MFP-a-like isoform X2 [Hibiscus syriacus]|uniref:glyoxysomal fatty acid beta-oxidation multifunctional protein MFP-a-like isoform X2 n=1 Tax=Hibiscus syriacus TaxID=106335 RepID=UPI001921C8AD|nr:glyoxysomal fatty acid beta-oxidation multifunctional protein MFP-a-like isoform X2 [Hibiscus syriacus]
MTVNLKTERLSGRMEGKTYLEIGADGVAIITINNPPLNLLSVDVMLSLKENTEQALQRDDVKAIVITGSNGKFSGGFDVTAFGKKGKHGKLGFWSIDFVTDILEAARKPLVAAIDGPALGGGLEIALACHARISTSSAVLGLPEIRYGILPGLGGTQRLPRLVGLRKALEMILMSKLVNGNDARGMGLVDAISSVDELVTVACHWAKDILAHKRPWIVSLYRADRLVPLTEAKMMLEHARVKSRKQSPNLKHPLVCIDVIEEGLIRGPRTALWKESEALNELRQSDTCRSLVYFFFARQRTSKAVGENISLKQRIFAELESYCPPLCILASSSFKINLNSISERMKLQNRFVGTHFFSQAHSVPILEIVATEKTSPQVIVDLLAIGKKMKKIPVVVHNSTGFAMNRMFFPYSQAAMMLVEHGVDLYQIDQAAEAFGMTTGPFRMIDFVGFEVLTEMKVQFRNNFGERFNESKLTSVMQEANQSGETTKKGFYIYDREAKFTSNPDIIKYVNKARSISSFGVDYELMKLSDEEIVEMIIFPVVNEACRLLEEKVVIKASDLDVASVTGMGFPEYRGGIIFWADTIGPNYICSKLEKWTETFGAFFKPCSHLAERASKRTSLGREEQAKSQL